VTALADAIVDWATIGKIVAYSLVIGVGATAAFAVAVHGITRVADMRRAERGPEATAYALLAIAGVAVSAGAVAFGVIVMTRK